MPNQLPEKPLLDRKTPHLALPLPGNTLDVDLPRITQSFEKLDKNAAIQDSKIATLEGKAEGMDEASAALAATAAAVDAITSALDATVKATSDGLSTEVATRAAADTAFSSALATESAAREEADATLTSGLTAETAAREAADAYIRCQHLGSIVYLSTPPSADSGLLPADGAKYKITAQQALYDKIGRQYTPVDVPLDSFCVPNNKEVLQTPFPLGTPVTTTVAGLAESFSPSCVLVCPKDNHIYALGGNGKLYKMSATAAGVQVVKTYIGGLYSYASFFYLPQFDSFYVTIYVSGSYAMYRLVLNEAGTYTYTAVTTSGAFVNSGGNAHVTPQGVAYILGGAVGGMGNCNAWTFTGQNSATGVIFSPSMPSGMNYNFGVAGMHNDTVIFLMRNDTTFQNYFILNSISSPRQMSWLLCPKNLSLNNMPTGNFVFLNDNKIVLPIVDGFSSSLTYNLLSIRSGGAIDFAQNPLTLPGNAISPTVRVPGVGLVSLGTSGASSKCTVIPLPETLNSPQPYIVSK